MMFIFSLKMESRNLVIQNQFNDLQVNTGI